MFLSDKTIKKLCLGPTPLISPFREEFLQSASYDVHLASGGKVIKGCDPGDFGPKIIDLRTSSPEYEKIEWDNFILYPGKSVIGSTVERVCIPRNIRSSVEGKSSLGRMFITAHFCAGYIDPAFRGNVVLEIHNASEVAYILYAGMPIAQLAFAILDEECERSYGECGNHYQGQDGTVESKWDYTKNNVESRYVV